MISTTKVLCFVAIAFADSDFQTDHDAVMRELSGGEPEGLDTTEEFRELVGDIEEFRELADASADAEEREALGSWWRRRVKVKACVKTCYDKWVNTKRSPRKLPACKKKCKARQLDEDTEEREAFFRRRKGRSYKHQKSACKNLCYNIGKNQYDQARKDCLSRCGRQLDEDEEAFAAVLV